MCRDHDYEERIGKLEAELSKKCGTEEVRSIIQQELAKSTASPQKSQNKHETTTAVLTELNDEKERK